jgi:PAS domain S-box-containing protein
MATAKKILVVDDDRVVLKFMEKLLSRNGHEVRCAQDGLEAVNLLTTFTPEIMFFDLIMPKIDGDRLIHIVRNMPHLKACFLVIVSAAVAEMDQFTFVRTGADYYIAKGPFDAMAENVLEAIKASEEPEQPEAAKKIRGLEHLQSRQLTKELLTRNRHLETILESMAEGILEVFDGHIVYANSAAIVMFGQPAEKLLTASPSELLEGIAGEKLDSLLADASNQPFEIGLGQPVELNGRQITIKKLPVKDDPQTVMLMFTDITERKRLEMQLQHIQKMEAIGTIAAGVAHNFRNTLTEVLVNSQLIQMNYEKVAGLHEIAERINTSVKRGARLVDGLLQFSRKQIAKEFKPFNLSEVIMETCDIVKKSFDMRIELQLEVAEGLKIVGDVSGISQVMMNLCTNARDAMPDGGVLRIEARREGKEAVVIVADTGYGMDRGTQEKCFDPFFTTKPIGQGTGLGLSTTYGIVKSHDGLIRMDSRPGKGTRFRLHFPLADDLSGNPATSGSEIIFGKGQCILVVDDEPEILRAMRGLLESLHYRPVFAEDGKEALARYQQWQPALVLLDINMPEMDGLECAQEILAYDPGANIAFLSGYEPTEPKLPEILQKDVLKGYLTKPVDISELSAFLSKALDT